MAINLGTLFWSVKVAESAEAAQDVAQVQDQFQSASRAAEQANAATDEYGESLSQTGDQAQDAAHGVGIADTATRLLGSRASMATGTITKFVGILGALGAAAYGAVPGLAALRAAIAGFTLSGALGAAKGAIAGFITWLGGASLGALSFAAALGTGLGLLGAWVLEVTGALDAVKRFGKWVGNVLPQWVVDGLLQIISWVAGPFAIIGAMIKGFFENGWSGAVARGKEALSILLGAWKRRWNAMKQFAANVWNGIKQHAVNFKNDVVALFGDLGSAMGSRIRGAFNSVIPSSVQIPQVTIGGGSVGGVNIPSATFGGQSIGLPQLQMGGVIEQSGVAEVHKGEAVIPEGIVDSAEGSSNGGSQTAVDITVGEVTLQVDNPNFDPSNLTRREIRDLAEKLTEQLGRDTTAIAGTR